MNFLITILLSVAFACNLSFADVTLLNDNISKSMNKYKKDNKTSEKDNNKQTESASVILLDDKINNNVDDIKTKLDQLPKTTIKYDGKQLNNNQNKVTVNAITYFTFGTEGKPLIEIYVSPSCLHCAQFLVKDLVKFLEKHSTECFIKVMLLPVEAKDFFIMKLIQAEAKDTNGYYMIFTNYMKRSLATIDQIIPTEAQQTLYKGSNIHEEMIKFQVIANNFGFSDEKIINAIPDMEADYECALVEYYKTKVQEIFEKLNLTKNKNQELEVPLIIYNGEIYKTLDKALKACKEILT